MSQPYTSIEQAGSTSDPAITEMRLEVLNSVDSVAQRAAEIIAAEARAAIADRGTFAMAVSGGKTPWQMLRKLGAMDLHWGNLHVFQVDERVAPSGHPDRNLSHIMESLVHQAAQSIHGMPVEMKNLDAAASDYVRTVERLAGTPPVLDLIHLGPDGHTASLVPGDSVLEVESEDIAATSTYQAIVE